MAGSYGNTYGSNQYYAQVANNPNGYKQAASSWYGENTRPAYIKPGHSGSAKNYNSGGSGGGSGGGGGGAGSPDELAKQYQDKLDEANKANEERYQDILGKYGEAYTRNMGYIDQRTGQAQTDLYERAGQENAINNADLVNRGLRNSTLGANQRAGVNRELSSELRRETDQALQQRLGVDYGMSKDTMDFMERKNEVAPDYDQMIALMNSLGKSGDGMSGNTGGGVANSLYSQLAGLGNMSGMYFPGAQLGQSVPGTYYYG